MTGKVEKEGKEKKVQEIFRRRERKRERREGKGKEEISSFPTQNNSFSCYPTLLGGTTKYMTVSSI